MWLLLACIFDLSQAAEVEEITVWGDAQVQQARQQLIEDLRILGYDRVKKRGDVWVLAHHDNWKGKIRLHDDGWIEQKRQAPRITHPPTQLRGALVGLAYFECIVQPTACVRAGGMVVSGRKLNAHKARTHGAIASDVSALSDRIADRELQRHLELLPERLEALWFEGVALEGSDRLITPGARKLALLRYWETRPSNRWGEQVRAAVESFLRAEVQSSDTPLSDDELKAFNLSSHAGRPLVLVPAGRALGGPRPTPPDVW